MNTPDIDAADMQSHAEQAAALLKSLAHPARLRVLCHLVDGEASVSELQAQVALSRSYRRSASPPSTNVSGSC